MWAARVERTARRLIGRRRDFAYQTLGGILCIWIQRRDRRKQRFGIRMARAVEQILCRSTFDNAPQIHHGDMVTGMGHDRQIMADEQER